MGENNIKGLAARLEEYVVKYKTQAAHKRDCKSAAQALRSLQIEKECLQRAREVMKWIRTDTAHKAPEQLTADLFVSYITKLEGALAPE